MMFAHRAERVCRPLTSKDATGEFSPPVPDQPIPPAPGGPTPPDPAPSV